MKSGPAAVRFHNVAKRYGDVTAVDGISFDIAPAELVTLSVPRDAARRRRYA